ncbi:MAG: Ig-like domain-containing protein, partial [Pseudomonadales bacterium]|nr:Ig-like domain-containing protein [Pseudomonadales bacterium]
MFAAAGDTATVTAIVLDADGSDIASPSLMWSSSDESTVTVSSAGVVTAVASGPASVKAQTGDQQAEISARVIGISCHGIQYSFTDLGLVLSATDVGQTDPMAPVANPSALQLDDGSIRLFFTNAGDGIASAISDDGITFSYETIRISGPAAQKQGVQLGPSRISRLLDGRVRLYVGSSESGVSSFISSDEGKTFTVEAGERITRTQANMDAIQKLSILPLSNGTYRGYFGPAPQHGPTAALSGTGGPPDHWLLSATSSDLLEWTVEPGVRIGPGSTVLTASAREVYPLLREDGCVTLFYQLNKPQDAGISDYEGVAVVGYSTSIDGLTFTEQFPLITTRDPAGPDVLTMPDGSL